MMTKDEALKMAIEAMEDVSKNCTYWELDISLEDFHMTINACKEALEQPSIESEFNRLADEGWCPALVFDDNGNWAITFDGIQPIVCGDNTESMHMTLFIEKDMWRPTISESLKYMKEHIHE